MQTPGNLFPELFDSIRRSFQAKFITDHPSAVPVSTKSHPSPEEAWLTRYSKGSPALASALAACASTSGTQGISRIARQRALLKERLKAREEALDLRRRRLAARVNSCRATTALRDALYRRRLNQQQDSAERRLQELLFEVGESARASAMRGASESYEPNELSSHPYWHARASPPTVSWRV